jgi:hypothetical protein
MTVVGRVCSTTTKKHGVARGIDVNYDEHATTASGVKEAAGVKAVVVSLRRAFAYSL